MCYRPPVFQDSEFLGCHGPRGRGLYFRMQLQYSQWISFIVIFKILFKLTEAQFRGIEFAPTNCLFFGKFLKVHSLNIRKVNNRIFYVRCPYFGIKVNSAKLYCFRLRLLNGLSYVKSSISYHAIPFPCGIVHKQQPEPPP